ncbi:Golgi transport complex subunit 3 [Podospora pseudocomata]|uniref:Conserved oligomeric Golgi complex subunit 3 n=1 Tax=Podospora pseudocomata TaxID=2093779 RepID=A0ABR0GD98_9PEZI|nr:Golgi transport complex subunit 3 [Podospora pseudocomata]
MFEDSWYSFVPDYQQQQRQAQSSGHQRKKSLLQPPNGVDNVDGAGSLPVLFEDQEDTNSPPEPTLSRRAKSYSDFYDIVKAQIGGKPHHKKKKGRRIRHGRTWEALGVPESVAAKLPVEQDAHDAELDKELLEASQQEFLLYHDQLVMTERHLGTLVEDANSALKVLESLSQSFRAVDDQTSSFKAQCDDLLTEQKRLQKLADDVGTDLHYYAYLDNVSRRLNAPGAGRLVEDDTFADILSSLDSCIAFMTKNTTYRDAESYLARYQALLTKALHLLEVGFTNRLNRVSAEISKQILATRSESARHALAYGRFEETLLESYSLIPNIQTVIRNVYDQNGHPQTALNWDIYANTANNIFHAYWAVRERDLKPLIQSDLDAFRSEAKESVETAARNFVKQCYERSYNEASLFRKIFAIETQYSTDPKSAFTALKSSHAGSLVTGTNVAPVATNLQSVLHNSDLRTVCNITGWVTNEYLLLDFDEDETPFVAHCRELTARLLTEHLWTFTDALFEAEISKSITKAAVAPDSLKIGPVTNNDSSSNAFPPIKRAIELLVMFDQSMPKERCQRNSPIIFSLLRESISCLHRAEARIRAAPHKGTDPDLFMIKNLLILKNELVTLEIGDIRNVHIGTQSVSGRIREMQHFGQIWDGILKPVGGNLIRGVWERVGSLGGTIGGYIPGSSLLGLGGGGGGGRGNGVKEGGGGKEGEVDVHEQLDDELRRSIVAFTKRWAGVFVDLKVGGGGNKNMGGRNVAKVEREMDEILERAFSGQGEVVQKLREAVKIQVEAGVEEVGRGRERERGGKK